MDGLLLVSLGFFMCHVFGSVRIRLYLSVSYFFALIDNISLVIIVLNWLIHMIVG